MQAVQRLAKPLAGDASGNAPNNLQTAECRGGDGGSGDGSGGGRKEEHHTANFTGSPAHSQSDAQSESSHNYTVRLG